MRARSIGSFLSYLLFFVGVAQAQMQLPGTENHVISMFYDMKDDSFGIEAIAPPDRVRELAICKAIKMAEDMHVEKISMGNRSYGQLRQTPGSPFQIKIPEGWVVLNATAYLHGVPPDGNPYISVAERAAMCRKAWDWYR